MCATLVWVATGSGCQLVQGPSEPPPAPVAAPDPAIESGSSSAPERAAAAEEVARARGALASGDDDTALQAARRVVAEYPTTPGSSEALWILAQAAFRSGGYAEAGEAGARYASLVPVEDERGAEALLLAARSRSATGDRAGGVSLLLSGSPERLRPVLREAQSLVRESVRLVETDGLEQLIGGVPETHPLLPAVLVEYGIGLYFGGRIDDAGGAARRVLAADAAEESDREVARSLLSGRVEETVGAAMSVGLILPATGSPTLQEYAELVQEGVEVALREAAERRRRPVGLTMRDDRGDPGLSRRSVRELQDDDVIAVVGPLLDAQLDEAARGRGSALALVSPTASRVPEGAQGVYSLAAPDPGAARALAAHATDRAYRRIALVYPRSPASIVEARAFLEAYGTSGRGEVREFPYEPGATSFGDQLRGAERFRAEALVLPVPDEDIELLAPQVSFYGLDTLGVEVLGTAAWGEAETLERIDPRHTDGVVVASPRVSDGAESPYERFVAAYESVHRRTLRSPIPAFGYDAARLVLSAIEAGARSPADLVARLERIVDHPGATGTISIVDGRIVRRHGLFELRQGELIPVGRAFE